MSKWEETKLGIFLKERREAPSPEKLLDGTIPIIDKISFKKGEIELRQTGETGTTMILAHPGDLVLSGINAYKGAIAIQDGNQPIAATIHYSAYSVDDNQADVWYLWWLLRSSFFRTRLEQYVPGGIKAELKAKRFLDIPIPLPSIEEQRRIVAHIEAVADRIAEARSLRQSADEETELTLSTIVTEVLNSTKADETTVESVARHVTDGDHLPPPKQDTGDVPFIFISNITTGQLDFENCKYVSWDYFNALSPTRVPKASDILYTAVGATYGRPCLIKVNTPFCFQRHIAIIKPNEEKVLPEYLNWAMLSRDVYKQATRNITGTAQPTVPLRAIRKLSFPLPNKKTQHRIVSYLGDLQAQVNALNNLQTETAVELDALLPSLLDRAFKGEL